MTRGTWSGRRMRAGLRQVRPAAASRDRPELRQAGPRTARPPRNVGHLVPGLGYCRWTFSHAPLTTLRPHARCDWPRGTGYRGGETYGQRVPPCKPQRTHLQLHHPPVTATSQTMRPATRRGHAGAPTNRRDRTCSYRVRMELLSGGGVFARSGRVSTRWHRLPAGPGKRPPRRQLRYRALLGKGCCWFVLPPPHPAEDRSYSRRPMSGLVGLKVEPGSVLAGWLAGWLACADGGGRAGAAHIVRLPGWLAWPCLAA